MRKVFLFSLLALFLVACSSKSDYLSQKSISEVEYDVLQSFEKFIKVSKALDTRSYFEFIDSEKFVGLNSDGTNWNSIISLKKLIEPSFNSIEKVESLVFTNVRISVIDLKTAVLVNEYVQKILLKDGEYFEGIGGGTQVWSKASGKWLLVSISASSK